MATAVLRSHDCLKGLYHLEAFGSRPPPAAKSHRKKTSRPSPPASHPPSSPPKPRQRQLARSPPPLPSSQAKPLGGTAANSQRPRRKSRSPAKESAPERDGHTKRALVIEEVRILKRGEVLKPAGEDRLPDGSDPVLCSTKRIGPEPDVLPKKLGLVDIGSVYAGPAFFASPSPSSLPIPGFLRGDADDATKSLRSALRLFHLQ